MRVINYLCTKVCAFVLILFLPYFAVSQNCNNWLAVPSYPSSVDIGKLNVPGHIITVEAMFSRTAPYSGAEIYSGDIVSKHNDPTDVNYLLRPSTAEITTSDGYFKTPDICDIQLNKTYYVAMVYDGVTLKFYRNGYLMSQTPATGELFQNNWEAEIGLYATGINNTNLIGYINEVRIWNVARTQQELQTYMNTSLPNPTTQTGLLAYYTFDNLINKQGNPAWNGTLRGSAAVNQTNPTCNAFVADNCGVVCPSLQGTLSGSTFCNLDPATLTFHSQSGTGPFTLTYSDGSQTYTQTGVMDGVAFQLSMAPTTTTTYTLLTIANSSGGTCAPTTAAGSITATVSPGTGCPAPPPVSCNNWINFPSNNTYAESGDLDIPGTQVTVEAKFCRTTAYDPNYHGGDLVSKHQGPPDVNYLLRPNLAAITTDAGYFQVQVCDAELNVTYHAAMVYDGTTLKYYRNGVLVGQTPAHGNLFQNNFPLRIGLYTGVFPETFIGYINEVRIWNIARTQAQIQANMNNSLSTPALQTGLLAYYTFDNLKNKQGNTNWDISTNSGALVNQNNPYCSVTEKPLQGTISGSNTCNNAPGLLTFHALSGTGPFTLTYSDGTQTYTQTNVSDGVPFAVQIEPTVSTTYTLLTIQDATSCLPSTVPPGATATINPGNCTLCTGSLGDPIINITFGSGTGNALPLETLVPGASTTNLTYVPVSGIPPIPMPQDGQYTISNAIPYNSNNWFAGGLDHTPGDVNGYMLFVNAGVIPGEVFRQKISNLCNGSKYEFSTWIAGADNPAAFTAVKPDLTFIAQTEDGTVLGTYDTGPINQQTAWTWQQYGFLFTLPAGISTVIIRIIDNNPGGNSQPGNDFAIDDITLRPCGPTTTASFSNTASVLQKKVCEGAGIILYGTVSGGYTGPQYDWQTSSDSGKTWVDIASSNNLQLTVTPPATGKAIDYYYRMLSADGSNIQSPNCRITSNTIILSVVASPNTDFSYKQDICNPMLVQFAGYATPGATYSWNVDGTDIPNTSTALALSSAFNFYGTYQIMLTGTYQSCPGSTQKSITIDLQRTDIISTPDSGICVGKSVALSAHPALDFCWSPTSYLDDPSSPHPTATPPVTTKYYYTAHTTGDNLVVNGDFSAGNTGFTSDYTYTNNGSLAGMYFVGPNPATWLPNAAACKDHTTGTGNMLLVNGAEQAGVKVWSQTITVQPNTNYAFSAWLDNITTVNPAQLLFTINGQTMGSALTANVNDCIWDQFYTSWNSGNATTAVISIVNDNTNPSGNDFALDDISFASVYSQRDSVTIDVETPAVTATPATSTLCPGVSGQLQVSGSLNYLWSPATGLSNDTASGPSVFLQPSAASETTVYTVTGTSARGCTADATVSVTQLPRLLALAPADVFICKGDATQLSASGGGTYSWSPAAVLDNAASATPLASPDTTTRFTLQLTDLNGCAETDSLLVRVKHVPVFHSVLDAIICKGFAEKIENINGPDYVYNWSPSTGLNDPSAPYPVASPEATTAYTVHITDSLCPAYNSTFYPTVFVSPSPVIHAEKANDVDCAIHTAQLRVTGGISYVWTPAAGLDDPLSATPMARIDSTTTYIVKGSSENGCYAYDTVTVGLKTTGANTFVVPNAFTPNGDGHNDCWGVQHWGNIQLEELVIFDRWGARIFSTRNPSDCWDGTFKGKPQETGAYPYAIKAHTYCGEVTRTGVVMLIR
jgi:gliding motility-associated-like protein